jgi:hypothetical protein
VYKSLGVPVIVLQPVAAIQELHFECGQHLAAVDTAALQARYHDFFVI